MTKNRILVILSSYIFVAGMVGFFLGLKFKPDQRIEKKFIENQIRRLDEILEAQTKEWNDLRIRVAGSHESLIISNCVITASDLLARTGTNRMVLVIGCEIQADSDCR